MNNQSRMVFLSAALAVTLASGCAAAYGSAIYETHADIYKAMTAGSYPERPARPHHVRQPELARHGVPKSSPVILSETPKRRLTPDARPPEL
jgi:hypothetical protein